MGTIDIDEFSLSYDEYGDPASPPLLIVHGLFGDSTTMAPLAERMSARMRVIAIDALGHGRSSHPADFSLADQGRVVDGLIAALGYESAAVLGVSMGSYVAAQAAILQPARVSKLVLVVSKASGSGSSSAAYAERLGFDLSSATPEEALSFMSGALWSPRTPPERRERITAEQAGSQPALTAAERAAVERSLADFDLRPGLPSITAPTLVISGRSDGLNPPELGEELARHIPGARFEVYERSGHMLVGEETDRLVAELEAFLLD